MIPGSNFTMESIIKYHSSGFYKDTPKLVFGDKPELSAKIKSMGLSPNPKLSELHTYFKRINKLRETFDKKCVIAGKSNIVSCIDSKIYDIKSKYDIKPDFPIRALFPQPKEKIEIDLRFEFISWPISYVSFHSWQEGYDAALYELGFLCLYEVQSVESLAIKNIEKFLRELYTGVAHAQFLDELINERLALTNLHPVQYQNIEDRKQIIIEALAPLKGRNLVGQQIMSAKEFDRLLNYTFYLVEHESVPPNIKPITTTYIATAFIRHIYYLLHKKFYQRRRRDYWFDFLHAVFDQFNSAEKISTKKHFSSYDGDFEADRKYLLESQKSLKSQ